MNKQTRENSTIRKNILETLDKIYPDNMIEMWNGVEVSYLEDVYENIHAKLSEIDTAAIEYERDWTGDDLECDECEGCEECAEESEDDEDDDEDDDNAEDVDDDDDEDEDDDDDDDDDEDDEDDSTLLGEEKEEAGDEPSEEDNLASSYHLFFLALQGDQFEFECQTEDLDEDGKTITLNGAGVVGCCVGISLLAPYAIVTPASMEIYDDDSCTYPDIDLNYIGLNKKANHLEDYVDANFTGLLEKKEIQALSELMTRVASTLESLGISMLPAEEADKPVPWLKPAEDVFIEVPENENITLKEALFYRGIF